MAAKKAPAKKPPKDDSTPGVIERGDVEGLEVQEVAPPQTEVDPSYPSPPDLEPPEVDPDVHVQTDVDPTYPSPSDIDPKDNVNAELVSPPLADPDNR